MYAHDSFLYEPYKDHEKHYDLDFKKSMISTLHEILENREYSRKTSHRINVICCCDNCGIKCLEP